MGASPAPYPREYRQYGRFPPVSRQLALRRPFLSALLDPRLLSYRPFVTLICVLLLLLLLLRMLLFAVAAG